MNAYYYTHVVFSVLSVAIMVLGALGMKNNEMGLGITLIGFGLALLVWCILYLVNVKIGGKKIRDKVYV